MGRIWLGLVAALVTGCAELGRETYELPLATAYERVAATDIGTGLGGLTYGLADPEIVVDRVPDASVLWRFKSNGAEYFQIMARLSARGDASTQVTVATLSPGGIPDTSADGIRRTALATERIAALLENRAFDPAAFAAQEQAGLRANPAAQQTMITTAKSRADQAIAKFDDIDADAARRAKEAEWARRDSEDAARRGELLRAR